MKMAKYIGVANETYQYHQQWRKYQLGEISIIGWRGESWQRNGNGNVASMRKIISRQRKRNGIMAYVA
jgi:hypothetical protein